MVNILQNISKDGARTTGKYLEKGCTLKEFDTREEAFKYAVSSAEEEVRNLMDGCDETISFGIPEDREYERMESVKVEYYNHEDDTTECVTERVLFEISSKNKEKR